MNRLLRGAKALAAAVFAACLCAGCTITSVEELYSLPEMSEEYVQLRELIGQSIDEGYTYAAPTGGSNRQSVQLRDLDGDGVAEALAFLADPERTPTVCIYRQGEEGNYYPYVVLPGDGASVGSVEYADITGDGAAELMIAWQISGDIRLLSVYSLGSADRAEQILLFSAACTEFVVCDLNGDGTADLLDLRVDYGGGSQATLYTVDGEGGLTDSAAPLSAGVTGVRRVSAGTLADGASAVFVEGDADGRGIITDVITAAEGRVRNITMTGTGSSDTLRAEEIFSTDIDGDLATEIPRGEGELWTWYGLDRYGNESAETYTCHDRTDGWYLVLTGPLTSSPSLERYGSGGNEPAVVFTVADEGGAPSRSVLVIYAVTGEDRLERATVDDRFILRQEEDTIYAAQLLTDELSQEDIIENFHLIYAEWQTGDL